MPVSADRDLDRSNKKSAVCFDRKGRIRFMSRYIDLPNHNHFSHQFYLPNNYYALAYQLNLSDPSI